MNMNKIMAKILGYEYKNAPIFIFIFIGKPYPQVLQLLYSIRNSNIVVFVVVFVVFVVFLGMGDYM